MRGNGWLREAPANLVPAEWLKIRGRSALRKCIFLPAPQVSPFAGYEHTFEPRAADRPATERMPRREAPRHITPFPRRRSEPFRHAMMFPAMPALPGARAQLVPKAVPNVRSERAQGAVHDETWTSPLAIGLLLIALPPAGLAAVWSHPRYDRDAKWALTLSTMMFMALATILVITFAR